MRPFIVASNYLIETNIQPGKIGINRDTTAMINFFKKGNLELAGQIIRKKYLDEFFHGFLKRKKQKDIDFVYLPQVLFHSGREKKIVRIHDLFPISHPSWFRKRATVYFKLAMRNTSRSYFLCNSFYTEKQLNKIYPNTIGKSAVMYCNLEPFLESSFECGECQVCNEAPDTPEQFALAIGTIEPRKNYHFLLSVWKKMNKQFPQKSLVIVGKYGWKSKQLLSDLTNSEGANILWFQNICEYSLKKLYKNCELFISTSHEEGFNYPAAEARTLSVPSLLSNNEVNKELHSDYATFFKQNDYDSFIDGYIQILKTKQNKSLARWKPPEVLKIDELHEIIRKL